MNGCYDWKNLCTVLEKLEKSGGHVETWQLLELEWWLLERTAIDCEKHLYIQEAKKCWQDLQESVVRIIQFLASHSLAFRGDRETLPFD
jgi:hypothetical protein